MRARVRVASAGTRSLRYDMTLERFRRTAAGDSTGASNSGLSRTPLLESTQPVSSQPVSSQLPPSQPNKRRYNVKWGEGREWLQYDDVEGAMFCSMCILQCTISKYVIC